MFAYCSQGNNAHLATDESHAWNNESEILLPCLVIRVTVDTNRWLANCLTRTSRVETFECVLYIFQCKPDAFIQTLWFVFHILESSNSVRQNAELCSHFICQEVIVLKSKASADPHLMIDCIDKAEPKCSQIRQEIVPDVIKTWIWIEHHLRACLDIRIQGRLFHFPLLSMVCESVCSVERRVGHSVLDLQPISS